MFRFFTLLRNFYKRSLYVKVMLAVSVALLLIAISATLVIAHQRSQILARADNLFTASHTWKPWGDNIIYTPVHLVSGKYYMVILKCALPQSNISRGYGPQDIVDVDLFIPGASNADKRMRIYHTQLSDTSQTFTHVFQSHDNERYLFRFINRGNADVTSSFIALEQVPPFFARVYMSLASAKYLHKHTRLIARFLIPFLALSIGLLITRKRYAHKGTVFLVLIVFLFLVSFIVYPWSLWLLLRLTGISLLLFFMGYGITIWSCGKHLKEMSWFMMPILGACTYAVLSLILAHVMPAWIAMSISCIVLLVFSILYICFAPGKRPSFSSWRPVVVCVCLGLITGAAPLYTKANYDTTVGVVCDAVRYTHMSQHFARNGYADFNSFENKHILRYKPDKLWARASLFPVQSGVARIMFLPENRVFTATMALFYMMFACSLYLLWRSVFGGRSLSLGLICVVAVLINSMVLSGIVDNYLSQVSSPVAMAALLVLGFYFIRHPSIPTAIVLSILASFLSQNYFISLGLACAGIGGMFLVSFARRRKHAQHTKRFAYLILIAIIVALVNYSEIYEFIQHIQLSNKLAVARRPHGGIRNMVGIFSLLGIDNHIAFQYHISISKLAPLYTPLMRWIFGILSYVICIFAFYKMSWYRRACVIPLLCSIIIMPIYFGYLKDPYLYYKSMVFLAPFVLLAFFVGVEKLARWRITYKIAIAFTVLIVLSSGYNYAISMYHYARNHPLLFDYDIIDTFEFVDRYLPPDEPLVVQIKNTNREYWLIQGLADLPLYIAGRSNDNAIDIDSVKWVLVQKDAPNIFAKRWWMRTGFYRVAAENSTFSLRQFIPPKERKVLFTLNESFNNNSGYTWSLSENVIITNNILRFIPSKREYEITAIKLEDLKPDTDYTFTVYARVNKPAKRGWLLVDLYGPGYDGKTQEMLIDTADLKKSWRKFTKTFNTEDIPDDVTVRIGTSADTVVEVREFTFKEEPVTKTSKKSIKITPIDK